MGSISFDQPYVDIDEWRDSPRRHRYVHGGFKGTHTRFSFYLPPGELYGGRFFQFLEGGAGGHETLLSAPIQVATNLSGWVFDLAFDQLGGYLVESNQGHFPGEGLGTRNDGSEQAAVNLYNASAESALFSRQVAREMYGDAPHHGYVWGISGGGLRSVYCLENRPDVYVGAAPHAGVHNTTQWPSWAQTWLFARDQFPAIIDATEPGGSGDPFAGLTHAQREALADMYRRGYPRGGENQLAPFTPWAFPMYSIKEEDPSYFEDFWVKPGYLGHDAPELLKDVLISEKTTIRQAVAASDVSSEDVRLRLRLATAGAAGTEPVIGVRFNLDTADDPRRLFMCRVTIQSGRAAGRELLISAVADGDLYSPFSEMTPDVFNDVEAGDEVTIDNRDFVAFCFYHRYAVEGMIPSRDLVARELLPWTVDGRPVYPQRATHGRRGEGTGKFGGKMIYVQPTLDNMVWNTTITGYHRLVQEHLGERIDEQFRLWWVENACHGTPELIGPLVTDEKDPGVWRSRLVSYDGVTSQALRELVRWVEEGVPPRSYGEYQMGRDNQLILPVTAAERGGVQPIVSATVNGSVRADVQVGETVTFTGTGTQPPGAGGILRAAWDFEGHGEFADARREVGGTAATVELTAQHTFTTGGTYFPSFRVDAHCDGADASGVPVQNLARVRVVVT
jgi:hypothetical protein